MTARSLLLLCCLLPGLAVAAEWLREEAAIMGTVVTVELLPADEPRGRALIAQVMDEMQRIDALMSSYKPDSELSRINATAADNPVPVSPELFRLIQKALAYSALTGGAFDITYASAGYLYDYRAGIHPDAPALKAALPAINYRFVTADKSNNTIGFQRAGMRIDLGGIAKGYAVDRCIDILRQAGIRNALVSAGGDTRVIGRRTDHPWNVGIRDPRKRDGVVSVIPQEDSAISTSGDYERYFEEGGVRYHHILDPQSGDSARALRSVSIIGDLAIDTDALSTSVFVLGVEKGLELVNSLPNTEAIIIDNEGRLHYSEGLAMVSGQ
jgi:thiamine biosynthesis lipoprotein